MRIKLLCFLTLLLFACEKPQPLLGDVHEHADFKVYLDGEAYNFAQDKYMSSEEHKLSNFTHLHDGDGEIIHKHMSTITLGDFFESLGMQFTDECFKLDGGPFYCNDGQKTLKMFVNGKENDYFGDYELNDLDRILITYGDETDEEIQAQIDSVGDRACIQSEKCPERGVPTDESSCSDSTGCETISPVTTTEAEPNLLVEYADIEDEWSAAVQRGDADSAPSYEEFMVEMNLISTKLETLAAKNELPAAIKNISQRLSDSSRTEGAKLAPTYEEAISNAVTLLQEYRAAIGAEGAVY